MGEMMSKEDHLFLLGNTEAVLGVGVDELLSMGLRQFVELCLDKGITPTIDMNGVAPGLTIDFASSHQPLNQTE